MMTAATAADVLGINRTRDGDLRPMVKALNMLRALNTPEEETRLAAGTWALANWQAYAAECDRRRNARRGVSVSRS